MAVRYYANGNLWFEANAGKTIVTVGVTDQAIDKIGDIEDLSLPSPGDDFDKGDIICTLEGSDGKVKITSPAAGFVHSINEELLEEQDLLTEAPNDEGWLVKIEIQDPTDLREFDEE